LNLKVNGITSTLSNHLGRLANLIELELNENPWSGGTPTELGFLLTNLVKISLANTDISGPVPSEIGLMNSLETAYLYAVNWYGTIPTELGQLTGINRLSVSNKADEATSELHPLEGIVRSLPSEMGNILSSMLWLFVYNTSSITSTIPTEIGRLTKIERIQLKNNRLTGTISNNLEALDGVFVDDNDLVGEIAEKFALFRFYKISQLIVT
jgi:hypothetical protein